MKRQKIQDYDAISPWHTMPAHVALQIYVIDGINGIYGICEIDGMHTLYMDDYDKFSTQLCCDITVKIQSERHLLDEMIIEAAMLKLVFRM